MGSPSLIMMLASPPRPLWPYLGLSVGGAEDPAGADAARALRRATRMRSRCGQAPRGLLLLLVMTGMTMTVMVMVLGLTL
jgi:hypothetical protein